MTTNAYDAIVVGARCAGSPTALLLARQGHRVLLLDRDHFPSDTISTHMVHPPGIALLKQWGLLDGLTATGCPGDRALQLRLRAVHDLGPAPADRRRGRSYGPRRTVLDKLLVDAAAEAGAEVREGFSVEEILFEDGRVTGVRGRAPGGESVTERARVVIGADGRHSLVAKAVRPGEYNEKPPIECIYYTYWSNLRRKGSRSTSARTAAGAALPTHDGLTLVVIGWPYAEFEARTERMSRGRISRALDLAPSSPNGCGRPAGGAVPRRRGPRLLSQALRARMGARRRRRLQQGPHHRLGNQRCLPGRGALRPGLHAWLAGDARSTKRWPITRRHGTWIRCRCSISRATSRPSRRPSGDGAAARRHGRHPGCPGSVRQRDGGHDARSGVLRAGKRGHGSSRGRRLPDAEVLFPAFRRGVRVA